MCRGNPLHTERRWRERERERENSNLGSELLMSNCTRTKEVVEERERDNSNLGSELLMYNCTDTEEVVEEREKGELVSPPELSAWESRPPGS